MGLHYSNAEECKGWGTGEDSATTYKKAGYYKIRYESKNYKEALPYWWYVFENAPGAIKSLYNHGIFMYEHFIDESANNEEQKQKYVDTLLTIYKQREKCFGPDGYYIGRKALTLAQHRRDTKEDVLKILDEFERATEIDGNKAGYYLFNMYMYIVVTAVQKEYITKEEGLEHYLAMSEIMEYNIKNGEGENKKLYSDAKANVDKDQYLRVLVENCEDAKNFEKIYKQNPEDQSTWKKIHKFYKASGDSACIEDPVYLEVVEKIANSGDAEAAFEMAQYYEEKGDKDNAKKFYELAIEKQTDDDVKVNYLLAYAGFLSNKLGSFSKARDLAQQAAELKPESGIPYIFIGDLYYSSSKLCGDDEVAQRAVFWIAYDTYAKAKNMDPSVAEKANSKMAKARSHFPEKEVLFMKTIKDGSSYTVGCWIGRTTTVRAK